MRPFALLLMAAMTITAQQQDHGQAVTTLLQSMVNGRFVSNLEFYSLVNEFSLTQSAPEFVRQDLALARKLMNDPLFQMQQYGAAVFIAAGFRPSLNGENLIEPYLPDLENLAVSRKGIRPMLLSVMTYLHPVAARTLVFMSSHLNDKDNNFDESNT